MSNPLPVEVINAMAENVKVLRLVRIHADEQDSVICDITNDPNVEPWFHIARYASTYGSIITKDGIWYHDVSLGAITDLTSTNRFTPEEQLIIKEAIKRYVKRYV